MTILVSIIRSGWKRSGQLWRRGYPREQVKVINEWVGHYAYNTFDQNAIVGRHTKVSNFVLMNGFSGHGLQQSPAISRGVSELILHGAYRSLDLGAFGYERIEKGEKFSEKAVI